MPTTTDSNDRGEIPEGAEDEPSLDDVPNNLTGRMTDDDRRVVAQLIRYTGLATSDIARLGLRALLREYRQLDAMRRAGLAATAQAAAALPEAFRVAIGNPAQLELPRLQDSGAR